MSHSKGFLYFLIFYTSCCLKFNPYLPAGVIGQHSLSVEALDISHEGEYIASCSLDNSINFWAIDYFENIRLKTEKVTDKQKKVHHNLPSSKFGNASDFFAALT